MSNPKIAKAVIPVAGLGTRMLPATKALRKEMLPIAGKPLIQYAIEEAAASGIETVILVTGDHSAMLIEHFERNTTLENLLEKQGRFEEAERLRALSRLVTFRTVAQSTPLGLGHAIYCSRELVGNEPFAVLLPDVIIHAVVPCTAQLVKAYDKHKASLIATRRLQQSELQRHGVIAPADPQNDDATGIIRVSGLIEKPSAASAPSSFGVFGRYLLQPSVFEYLESLVPSAKAEVQLTDALSAMAKDHPMYGVEFAGDHFDAGDPVGFVLANVAISLKDGYLGPRVRELLRCHLDEASNPKGR